MSVCKCCRWGLSRSSTGPAVLWPRGRSAPGRPSSRAGPGLRSLCRPRPPSLILLPVLPAQWPVRRASCGLLVILRIIPKGSFSEDFG